MKKDPKSIITSILYFIFTITMLINVFAYPIGSVLTSPSKVNKVMDKVDLESLLLDAYVKTVVEQISKLDPQVEDKTIAEIESQIEENLMSPEKLRKQRIQQVEAFYQSLDKNEVPKISLELDNPLYKIQKNLSEKGQTLVNKIKNIRICKDDGVLGRVFDLVNQETLKDLKISKTGCISISQLISIATEKEIDPSNNTVFEPTYKIETSFGINQDNIKKITQTYRVLKYGPQVLMVLDFVLLLSIYLINYKSKETASKLLRTVLAISTISVITWILVPLIFKIAQPFKIEYFTGSKAQATLADAGIALLQPAQNLANAFVRETLNQMSLSSFTIPIIFTIVTSLVFIAYIMFSQKNLNLIDSDNGVPKS